MKLKSRLVLVCHGASASVNIAYADEIYESLHVRKLSNYGRLNSAGPAGPEAGSRAQIGRAETGRDNGLILALAFLAESRSKPSGQGFSVYSKFTAQVIYWC